jgi:hypothetical protein
MSGTVEENLILSVHDPVPFPIERVRKYNWYERFTEIEALLVQGGMESPSARAEVLQEVEKKMRIAGKTGYFGVDKNRSRALALLCAELHAADPNRPAPGTPRPKLEAFA